MYFDNDWTDEELEADYNSLGWTRTRRLTLLLLLEIVNMDAEPSGFILVPGNPDPVFLWGKFSGGFNKKISKDDRYSIICYLKELADMSSREENTKPEVGYIHIEVDGRDLVFILQTRPTSAGEEAMVRFTNLGDPTIPFAFKEQCFKDKAKKKPED